MNWKWMHTHIMVSSLLLERLYTSFSLNLNVLGAFRLNFLRFLWNFSISSIFIVEILKISVRISKFIQKSFPINICLILINDKTIFLVSFHPKLRKSIRKTQLNTTKTCVFYFNFNEKSWNDGENKRKLK